MTTSVSPSQCPTECPYHVGPRDSSCSPEGTGRPSSQISRRTLASSHSHRLSWDWLQGSLIVLQRFLSPVALRLAPEPTASRWAGRWAGRKKPALIQEMPTNAANDFSWITPNRSCQRLVDHAEVLPAKNREERFPYRRPK